jgi:ankyrin repeat protein
MTKSIENYLENPNRSPLERFLKESKYSIQPTTFNLKISDPKAPIQFRSARYFKPNTFGSIIRLLQKKRDLIAAFKEVISKDIKAIKDNPNFGLAAGYQSCIVSEEIALDEQEAQNIALGILNYGILNDLFTDKETRKINNDFKEYLSYITKLGVDINDNNAIDQIPLYTAAQEGHHEAVKILLENGAKVDQVDNDGTTPLYIASQQGHYEVVKILLEAEADIDCANDDDSTPLWIASQQGHYEIVEILIEAEADIDCVNHKGATPLWIAAQNGHYDVVQRLIDAGADVNKADKNGRTALSIAWQQGHYEIVKILLAQAGIKPTVRVNNIDDIGSKQTLSIRENPGRQKKLVENSLTKKI